MQPPFQFSVVHTYISYNFKQLRYLLMLSSLFIYLSLHLSIDLNIKEGMGVEMRIVDPNTSNKDLASSKLEKERKNQV